MDPSISSEISHEFLKIFPIEPRIPSPLYAVPNSDQSLKLNYVVNQRLSSLNAWQQSTSSELLSTSNSYVISFLSTYPCRYTHPILNQSPADSQQIKRLPPRRWTRSMWSTPPEGMWLIYWGHSIRHAVTYFPCVFHVLLRRQGCKSSPSHAVSVTPAAPWLNEVVPSNWSNKFPGHPLTCPPGKR